MNITPHFSISEFHCRDGTPYPELWIEDRLRPLCEALEKIRADANGPLIITSGFRTPSHNKRERGVKHSQHLYGRAADFKCPSVSPKELGEIVKNLMDAGEIPLGGLKIYEKDGFVHYDQRGSYATWG